MARLPNAIALEELDQEIGRHPEMITRLISV
jgi:hypothetical protein